MYEKTKPIKYLLLSLLLIIIDQGSKMLVHYFMEPGFPGQIVLLGDWLKLHYVLNPGMAFGMQLGHEYGKLFLTLFRLVAMCVICWYLIHLAIRGASKTLLLALSLILAGAVGNVIDSIFYGVFLGNAPVGSPSPWFHGQVVDMIFVDFWEGFLPDWIPIFGGQYYSTPIFNIADSCIFIGVCIVLIFQGHFYQPQNLEEDAPAEIEETSEKGESDPLSEQQPTTETENPINPTADNQTLDSSLSSKDSTSSIDPNLEDSNPSSEKNV
jgi:signal peptidase II